MTAIPSIYSSGGRIIPHDYDKDGDMDVLVTGRLKPHAYPDPGESFLLENVTARYDQTDSRTLPKKNPRIAPD